MKKILSIQIMNTHLTFISMLMLLLPDGNLKKFQKFQHTLLLKIAFILELYYIACQNNFSVKLEQVIKLLSKPLIWWQGKQTNLCMVSGWEYGQLQLGSAQTFSR